MVETARVVDYVLAYVPALIGNLFTQTVTFFLVLRYWVDGLRVNNF